MKKRLLTILLDAYPKPLTLDQLVHEVYSGTMESGPLNAKLIVRITIGKLRKSLKPFGWTIPRQLCGRGNVGQFKLEPLMESEK